MAQTADAPDLVQTIGAFNDMARGLAGGSGTTTVVTVPQLRTVEGVLVGGATSTTAVYCDTVSGNGFTATHASGDLFAWIAWGKAKV